MHKASVSVETVGMARSLKCWPSVKTVIVCSAAAMLACKELHCGYLDTTQNSSPSSLGSPRLSGDVAFPLIRDS